MKRLNPLCQCQVNSLDLRDVRGLLDDAVGDGGPYGAALPQARGGPRHTHPVYYSGPGERERPPGAAPSRAGAGDGDAALFCHTALSLGQVSQSHGSVDLPPTLAHSPVLGSALWLLPVNRFKR